MNLPDDFASHLPGSPYAAGPTDLATAMEAAAESIDSCTGPDLTARLIAAADKLRARAEENAGDAGTLADVARAMTALRAAVAQLEAAI